MMVTSKAVVGGMGDAEFSALRAAAGLPPATAAEGAGFISS